MRSFWLADQTEVPFFENSDDTKSLPNITAPRGTPLHFLNVNYIK